MRKVISDDYEFNRSTGKRELVGKTETTYNDHGDKVTVAEFDVDGNLLSFIEGHAEVDDSPTTIPSTIQLTEGHIDGELVDFYFNHFYRNHDEYIYDRKVIAEDWRAAVRSGFVRTIGVKGGHMIPAEKLYTRYLRHNNHPSNVVAPSPNPDVITTDFVEFYLEKVGLNKDNFYTRGLVEEWKKASTTGNIVPLAEDVFFHMRNGDVEKIEANTRYTVTRNKVNGGVFVTSDWLTLDEVYEEYLQHKAAGFDYENFTPEFAEFYLEHEGVDPKKINVGKLAHKMRKAGHQASIRGVVRNAAKYDGALMFEHRCGYRGSHVWSHPALVYEKYLEQKVAA